jgi:hypothetical protein
MGSNPSRLPIAHSEHEFDGPIVVLAAKKHLNQLQLLLPLLCNALLSAKRLPPALV